MNERVEPSALAVCIVSARSLAPGPTGAPPADRLERLAGTRAFPAADLLDVQAGWLSRLASLSGAPFPLNLYVSGQRGPDWQELDAFALATVYGQVIWDDRIWGWHTESGRPDSAERLREIHDLALRCYRNLQAGERLVLVETPRP